MVLLIYSVFVAGKIPVSNEGVNMRNHNSKTGDESRRTWSPSVFFFTIHLKSQYLGNAMISELSFSAEVVGKLGMKFVRLKWVAINYFKNEIFSEKEGRCVSFLG